MNDRNRYVVAGAAIGALVGALAGLIVARSLSDTESGEQSTSLVAGFKNLDRGMIFRLGASVLAVVRQLAEIL